MLTIQRGGIFETKERFDSFPTPIRTTEQYEWEIHTPGDSIWMMNGEKYTLTENSIFMIPPGTERFSLGPFTCVYLHFSTDESDLVDCISALPLVMVAGDDSALRTQFLEIAKSDTSTPEGRIQQRLRFETLLLKLREIASKAPASPSVSHKYAHNLMAAKAYMDANYSEKITLEALSKLSFLSKNYFRTLFSEHFGISPTDYLTKIRIAHAIELFKTTEEPFSEIALNCGFMSQSYMNAVIKESTGKTPKEYRQGMNH